MNITQKITLDLTKRSAFQYVSAKQGDNSSRFVEVTLTDGDSVYIPPDGATASFRAQKPDGTMVLNQAVVNSNGTVTVELTQQTLAASGDVIADIYLTDGADTVLSTASFVIRVEPAPMGITADSDNEFLILVELVKKAEDSAKQSNQSAKIAQDFAKQSEQAAGTASSKVVEAATSAKQAATSAEAATKAAGDAQQAASNVHETVTTELEKAKVSGEFDGPKGDKGDRGDGFTATDDGNGNVTIIGARESIYPEMLVGKEYETNERWDGRIVYSMLINIDHIPYNGIRSVYHKIDFLDMVIRCAGVTADYLTIPYETYILIGNEVQPITISVSADIENLTIRTCNLRPGIERSATVQIWYIKNEEV